MSMTRSTVARGGTLIKPNERATPTVLRRDPRIPLPSSVSVTRVMKANRARNTTPELRLRRALRRAGVKGYRTNWPRVPGRPDIAFPGDKFAVFVHGCFWHRCPHCNLPLPKSNRRYWKRHFRENEERDKRKVIALKAIGWRVTIQWECEINEDVNRCAKSIRNHLNRASEEKERRLGGVVS
jgi:DNA mismatch endonuclease (patch repair protein)